MENAVVTSVVRDAQGARARERGAWKAGSIFGLGLIAAGMAILLAAILSAGADPGGLSFVLPILGISIGLAFLVKRQGRWAQAVAGLASLALGALVAPVVPHVAFDSFFDLVPIAMLLVGIVAVVGSAGADLAQRESSPRAKSAVLGAGISVVSVLAFVGLASAIATFAGQETLSAAEREGLTSVAMKDAAFAPKKLTVTEGEQVRIALKNSDPVIHDLRIADLDLKFTVKPGSEKAFEFTAPDAGTYKFDCSLHTNMKGVLEVVAR